jgi:hypothetical protein
MEGPSFSICHPSFFIGKTETAKSPRTAEFAKKSETSFDLGSLNFVADEILPKHATAAL